jgi:hypothetical protein
LKGGTRRRVAEKDLAEIFGLELEDQPRVPPQARSGRAAGKAPRLARQADAPPFPAKPSGKTIRELRDRLMLTQAEFAARLGVSGAAVSKWERTISPIRFHLRSRMALQDLWEKTFGRGPRGMQ